MSRYYITDGDGRVVAKLDGIEVSLKDGHEVHEVESVNELSDVDVDEWDSDYGRI